MDDVSSFNLADLAGFPDLYTAELPRVRLLKQGANVHQSAALYGTFDEAFKAMTAFELTYRQVQSASAGAYLMGEFEKPAIAFFKYGRCIHVASALDVIDAWAALPPVKGLSELTVVLNRTVDLQLAQALKAIQPELILAPHYVPDTLDILANVPCLAPQVTLRAESLQEVRSVASGFLVQDRDRPSVNTGLWHNAGALGEHFGSAVFAWRVAKHAPAPAAVYVQGESTRLITPPCHAISLLPSFAHSMAHSTGVKIDRTVIALNMPIESFQDLEAFARHKPLALLHSGVLSPHKESTFVTIAESLGFPLIATERSAWAVS